MLDVYIGVGVFFTIAGIIGILFTLWAACEEGVVLDDIRHFDSQEWLLTGAIFTSPILAWLWPLVVSGIVLGGFGFGFYSLYKALAEWRNDSA